MRQPHHLLPQPNLSVLVLGFGLRHLDRLDQVLHRLVEAHVAGRRALLEVLDDEVVRIPHVVMGSHAPAGETHRSTTSSYREIRYASVSRCHSQWSVRPWASSLKSSEPSRTVWPAW